MIDTISEYQFTDWFMKHRPNNFSYEGTKALFNYLTELEEDCGQPMEFDPIAFCCEYDEYDSIEECLKQYDDIDIHPSYIFYGYAFIKPPIILVL